MLKFPKSAVLTLALSLAMGVSLAAAADVKSVAVTAIVEHPALTRPATASSKPSIRPATSKATTSWQYQSAQGNTGTAAQIARKFIGDKADVLVGIATPTAQALAAGTKQIPIVFTAVTDPVQAQLTPSWEASGTNVTGVSDVLELDKQIDLIKEIIPDAKKVGIVYNPGEANSVAVVEALKKQLPEHGMELVEAAAPRTVDVRNAALSLAGKVDVIYTNTDNNVVSAYEAMAKVGNDTKTPLIASDTDSVKRGAIAALGVDYHDLGVQTGRIVARILDGEKPGDIAPQTSDNLQLFINVTAAEKQGVLLSEELLLRATQIIR